MIKVIAFDLGGVCLTDCWSSGVRKKIAKRFKISYKKNEKELHLKVEMGKISEDEFLRRAIFGRNFSISKIKQEIRRLNRNFPETFKLVRKLKRNYKLVVLNNEGHEWNEFRKRKFKLSKYFDEFYPSCDLLMCKPDPRFYRRVLRQLRIRPNKLLFVDNEKENIISAKKLGIKTIWFRNLKQLKIDLINLGIKF